MNYVIRPVTEKDMKAVIKHAQASSASLSLPRNPHLMSLKLKKSVENFAADIQFPANEFYLFVLEDLETHECVGVSGINSRTGVSEPMFFYRMEGLQTDRSIPEMDDTLEILRPVREVNAPSEMCALFLNKDHRKEGLGKLLSFSRFLFMADFPHRFDKKVFANMIGVVNDDNTCPFWDSVGRRFFHVDFLTLMERLHYNRSFITSLIPPIPIYIALLPPEVQKLIGQTHPATTPALHILMSEGFTFTKKIDPFDGGPVVSSPVTEIRTIKHSKIGTVGKILVKSKNLERYLISNRQIDYRCCFGGLQIEKNGTATILKETAKALNIKEGDSIRFIPLPLKKEKK